MLIYILLLILLIYSLFLSRITIKNSILPYRERFVAKNEITLMVWGAILLILAILKDTSVGTDSKLYYWFFKNRAYSALEPGISYIYELAIEYNSFYVFSTCIYILIIFFFFRGIKKNCPNYLIGILLFIITFIYFTGYNQLRQMIAAAIIFSFVNFLISDSKIDRLKFMCIILTAFLFHKSAFFLMLLFFVPRKKFSSKVVIPLFICTCVIYFIPELKNSIGQGLIQYSGFYADKYEAKLNFFFTINKEKGLLQFIPVFIQMILVVYSMYFPKEERRLSCNKKLYDFSFNMVVLFLALYSLSGIEAIDRIQIYYSCFNIYFYSIWIHMLLNCKKKLGGQIVTIMIIAFWMLYYVLRLMTNVQGVVPYSIFR